MIRFAVVLVCAAGVAAIPVAAQSRPVSLAFDISVGASTLHGGEYRERDIGGIRIAASLRKRESRIAPYAELAYDIVNFSMGENADCMPNGYGGCIPYVPSLAGPEFTMGVLMRVHNRIEVRGGGGVARITDEKVSATAWLAQADVALFPLRRVAVVGGTRPMVVPNLRGARLRHVPWSLGIRIR